MRKRGPIWGTGLFQCYHSVWNQQSGRQDPCKYIQSLRYTTNTATTKTATKVILSSSATLTTLLKPKEKHAMLYHGAIIRQICILHFADVDTWLYEHVQLWASISSCLLCGYNHIRSGRKGSVVFMCRSFQVVGNWHYLRRYLRAQSQGHHTIDRLEERGVERGSARRSSLEGWERSIWRQSGEHRNFFFFF